MEQRAKVLELQLACFPAVTAEEVEEDFCRPPVTMVLAYREGELIGCAEVFKRQVTYEGRAMTLGGFGPCVRADLRKQGIGTQLARAALGYLKAEGCAVAFVSVSTDTKTHLFYEQLGFRMLPQPFVYVNVHGERLQADGGMIAPLGSEAGFVQLWQGGAPLFLGPEAGYW